MALAAGAVASPAEFTRREAFFGDLHMHTALSLDAYLFGVRAMPEDAYRFARGHPLRHPLGQEYRLRRPLDFMAVTDHAVYMGALARMRDRSHPISAHPMAERLNHADPDVRRDAYLEFTSAGRAGRPIQGLAFDEIARDAWERTIAAANDHYAPGRFTTFIGYEWSSAPAGRNLHRNIIFRGDAAPLPFSRLNSMRPEDLWNWMESTRAMGYELLAIPHNPNLSDGLMFETVDSRGEPLTAAYAERRQRNEPVVEIIQIKGTSETHPRLSPDDEFADFELVEQRVGMAAPVTRFRGSYARDALKTGLLLQRQLGVNPFRFGMIGSTDSHTGIVTDREDSYSGEIGEADGTAELRLYKSWFEMDVRRFSAAGLTGVWAERNTRESIFDALARREAWATSGPRIQLRFFGGFALDGLDLSRRDWVAKAYRLGTTMGGTLAGATHGSPTFVVWARKDPDGARLDRIQIVKGWLRDGEVHERVFDVERASYRNTVGAAELTASWKDPDFDPGEPAFYYARVLEIPTPRWSAFDARELGVPHPEGIPAVLQERAIGSPIWYDSP